MRRKQVAMPGRLRGQEKTTPTGVHGRCPAVMDARRCRQAEPRHFPSTSALVCPSSKPSTIHRRAVCASVAAIKGAMTPASFKPVVIVIVDKRADIIPLRPASAKRTFASSFRTFSARFKLLIRKPNIANPSRKSVPSIASSNKYCVLAKRIASGLICRKQCGNGR